MERISLLPETFLSSAPYDASKDLADNPYKLGLIRDTKQQEERKQEQAPKGREFMHTEHFGKTEEKEEEDKEEKPKDKGGEDEKDSDDFELSDKPVVEPPPAELALLTKMAYIRLRERFPWLPEYEYVKQYAA